MIRWTLGLVLALLALNAFGGGYYGLAGAEGVPVEWLEGSPFHSYTVPSLFLFVVVGGSSLLAAVAVFARWRHGSTLALATAVIVLAWLAVQLAIIGYVSWMQPTTAVAACVIAALALRLRARRPGLRVAVQA